MAAGATKRPKASAVKQASIGDTNSFLQSLPDKPKEDLSLREAIDQMRETVQSALAKGYTYQELAAMLTERGVRISAFTLKNYVPSGRRRAAKEQPAKQPTRRGRKAKADTSETSEASEPKTETGAAPVEEVSSEVAVAEVVEAVEALTAEEAPKPTAAKGARERGKSTAAKTATAGESTVKQATSKRPRSTTAQQPKDAADTAKPASTRGRKKA